MRNVFFFLRVEFFQLLSLFVRLKQDIDRDANWTHFGEKNSNLLIFHWIKSRSLLNQRIFFRTIPINKLEWHKILLFVSIQDIEIVALFFYDERFLKYLGIYSILNTSTNFIFFKCQC